MILLEYEGEKLIFGAIGWGENGSEDHDQPLKAFIKNLVEIDDLLINKDIHIDLLLCAGLTVDTTKKSKLKKKLKEIKNIKNILFEKYTDFGDDFDFYKTNYCLFSKKNNDITIFPSQLFETTFQSKATKTSITKEKSKQLANYILNKERNFEICNQNFVLLVCGENNIIKGNKPNLMTSLILNFSEKPEKLQNILNKSIIVNPSHYPYKINGKKRLEMMKNITRFPSLAKKNNPLMFKNYLHANNYSLTFKNMLKKENLVINSKYPNGSFFFSDGEYKKVVVSSWGGKNKNSYILNIWNMNKT